MSKLEDKELKHEIVLVGRQLAFVNHKWQVQMQTMKELIHEYEASLVVEEMMDCLGYLFSLGSRRMDLAQPLLIPTPCHRRINDVDKNMTKLSVVILPLLQYDMFSWKAQNLDAKMGKISKLAYTHITPLYKHVGFEHVHVVALGRKEVDMLHGLWEDLHREIVHTRNAQLIKSNHPVLHTFYTQMEAQLCAITKCHLKLCCNIPLVHKFFEQPIC